MNKGSPIITLQRRDPIVAETIMDKIICGLIKPPYSVTQGNSRKSV